MAHPVYYEHQVARCVVVYLGRLLEIGFHGQRMVCKLAYIPQPQHAGYRLHSYIVKDLAGRYVSESVNQASSLAVQKSTKCSEKSKRTGAKIKIMLKNRGDLRRYLKVVVVTCSRWGSGDCRDLGKSSKQTVRRTQNAICPRLVLVVLGSVQRIVDGTCQRS